MQNSATKIEEISAAPEEEPDTDTHLFGAEIRVNQAHCEALFHAGILTRLEAERIKNGLQTILKRAEYDKNYLTLPSAADVHTFVYSRLVQLVGESGRKLSVGRSESEHRRTTLRLWLRTEIELISILIKKFQSRLIAAGENQKNVIFPVGTGFDKKRVVLWVHWCLAHFERLERDKERLEEIWRRVNVSPFGAVTPFEIEREEIAAALGFEGVSANSLDAVADADFIVEFCSACSLLSRYLENFSEETQTYLSKEFGLLEFKEKHPSMREKNLNYLQSIGAKASQIAGYQLASLLANKNSRVETKTLFDTAEATKFCLKAIAAALDGIAVNEFKAQSLSIENYAISAEIINYLLKKDVFAAAASETAVKILECATAKNKQINELSLTDLQSFSAQIEKDFFHSIRIQEALAARNQVGGTAPERVFEALDAARESLEREEI